MDSIIIKDLEVYAKHGVLKEENKLGQKFLISVKMDIEKFKSSDDLDETIDYSSVCKLIYDFMTKKTYKLIETVASKLADIILMKYDSIKEVHVKVKKPWAPIGLPIDSVSVEVTRKKHLVYLGLGSNMGDKNVNIKKAIEIFANDESTKLIKCSSLIETKPYGYVDQDDFLNGVMLVATSKSPEEVLDLIGCVEKELLRVREIHWGPRTIDVDILFYDDIIMNTKDLTIPHSQIQYREFVLKPLCEIASDLIHPVFKRSVNDLYKELKDKENKK